MADKWIKTIKGGPGKERYEIAVCRTSFRDGLIGFGQFGKNKVSISENTIHRRKGPDAELWEYLTMVADRYADSLNEKENKPTFVG